MQQHHHNLLHRLFIDTQVGRLQPPAPLTCFPGTTIGDILPQMMSERVGCVFVVDDTDMLVGIMTERDLLKKVGS
ncbi:MAG: CBS domain-containing protein, partial [Bdellovibrionales bacterium]|nr:CBS domain-containing protein [Bdellovibrionales bacterium]